MTKRSTIEKSLFQHQLAIKLLKGNQIDKAAKLLKKLRKKHPQWKNPTLTLIELTLSGIIQPDTKESNCWFKDLDDESLDSHAFAIYLKACLAEQNNDDDEAESLFQKCIRINPDFDRAQVSLAILQLRKENWYDAEKILRKQLDKNPIKTHLLLNLAIAVMRQNRLEEALLLAEQSAKYALPQEKMAVHVNLGSILQELGKREQASNHYKQVIKLDPNHINANLNIGVLALQNKDFETAEFQFRKTLEISPNNSHAAVNLAGLLLMTKRNKEGWYYYEKRLHSRIIKHELPPELPCWDGKSLKGSLILAHEQGLGDSFQFIRYAKILRHQGFRCHYYGPKKLHGIFTTSRLVDQCFSNAINLPKDAEAWIPLMSIIPRLNIWKPKKYASPYLRVSKKKITEWQDFLGSTKKQRLAIHWQGNPDHEFTISRGRSLALEKLNPLLNLKNIEWISLQKGAGCEQAQVDPWRSRWHDKQHIIDDIWDFEDNLAILSCCDGLISSDSGLAHLAGAGGINVCLMLPWLPEWRWGLEVQGSEWYPNHTLYRQEKEGDWESVVNKIKLDLENNLN